MPMPWELSILDGAHALLLQAKLAVIGDTAITGDLAVSGEIIGGTIPIENLSNVDKQSFENKVDGDFKLWSAGDSAAPDGWTLLGGSVERESVITKIGGNSAKVIAADGGTRLRCSISNYADYASRIITVGAWIYSSVANKALITINDGVGTDSSSYHTGGGDWEFVTVTKTISASPTQLYVRLYPDNTGTTNFAYFDGVVLVEGPLCPAFSPKPLTDPHTYGEMYIYNNSNATVIETANIPIALRQISGGLQKGFIFDAGSTGAIIGYTDYSGTVAGTVRVVSSVAHGLNSGDVVTIRGTTNYNGIFKITKITTDTFYIFDTWVADDGGSDWDKGASLTAQAGADGVYTSTWQMTTAPAGACELCFKVNINEIPQNKSTACRDMAINDKDNNSSTCLMSIVENDIIWLSVESDATSDITNSMGNMNLERM